MKSFFRFFLDSYNIYILSSITICILIYIFSDKSTSINGLKKGIIPCSVNKVIDGDTIYVYCDEKKRIIRLSDMDAPEITQEKDGIKYGIKAKKNLESYLYAKKVLLNIKGEGVYKRVIASILLEKNHLNISDYKKCKELGPYLNEGRLLCDIALLMLYNGDARIYKQYNPPDKYINAMNYAKRNGIGIWKKEGLQQDPRKYRQLYRNY